MIRVATFVLLVVGVAAGVRADDPPPAVDKLPPLPPPLPPPDQPVPKLPPKPDVKPVDPPLAKELPPPLAKAGGPADAKTDPAEAAALGKLLQDLLVKHLPDPLTKSSHNWGNQKVVVVQYREGFRRWSEPVEEKVNDGLWRKYSARIPEPGKVTVAVTELTHPEDGKTVATIAVASERVDFHMEHQLWRNGRRLYGGETNAHCKGAIVVKAEVISKTEFKKGSLLPEVTMTVKILDAKLHYDDIVVDKTAGFEGQTAQALGDAAIKALRSLAPDLERNLVEKANAAIVKAAGTREFKVALDGKPKK